jgi:hypothetical protein
VESANQLASVLTCGLLVWNDAVQGFGIGFKSVWYSVTGFYRSESGAVVTSKPETIEVLPRTATQMDEYVHSLESKLADAKSKED